MTKVTRWNFINLAGKKVGFLTVLRLLEAGHAGGRLWVCRCICKKEKLVYATYLYSQRVTSCGCMKGKSITAKKLRHGDNKTGCRAAEYTIWQAIKQRCLNPRSPAYKDYGGRGISLDPRWLSYKNFLEDVGRRPSKRHTLDRRNNDGPYTKKNCRWATRLEQGGNTRRNVRITLHGKTRHIMEWSRITGLHHQTISRRLRAGWPSERILTERPRKAA